MITNTLKFLETYQSKGTVKTYKVAIRKFLLFIYKDGELEDLSERYFKENRNYENDVQDYYCSIKGSPPKTINVLMSVVRTFLIENRKELSQYFWRRLNGRVKGSQPWTEDKIPTKEELRKILTYLPPSGKALCLVLSSSGMRIGECLSLLVSDVDFTTEPTTIRIRGCTTKSGNKRITFISSEAKEVLQEWIKDLPNYIIRSSKNCSKLDDKRIFPLTTQTTTYLWNLALKKAGLDARDNNTSIRFRVHHIHTLRKFFRTRLGSKINSDIIEVLLGHEGYLTSSYRKFSDEELSQFYLKGVSELYILKSPEEVNYQENLIKENNLLKERLEKIEETLCHLLELSSRANEEDMNKVDALIKRFVT